MTRARLVFPSGPCTSEAFEAGLATASELGLDADWEEQEAACRAGYLAGSDAWRAEALLDGLRARPDRLWMARGGYGAIRTLDALGDRLASAPPGPLWGFSDGTALLAAWRRLGWPAWLAPPLIQLPRLDEDSRTRFVEAWTTGQVAPLSGLRTVAAGEARGQLAGGNLCVLASLLGTPFEAALGGTIVVLEDVGEAPYRVDRLFTQLRLAGAFAGVAGVVLGDFTGVDDEAGAVIQELLAAELGQLGVPVAAGLPVGHGSRNAVLPFHQAARLSCTAVGATLCFPD